MEVIREKRTDGKGYLYRFPGISRIQNDTKRRLVLALSFPIFFVFNCLAVIPIIALSFIQNNIQLVDITIERWKKPMEPEG